METLIEFAIGIMVITGITVIIGGIWVTIFLIKNWEDLDDIL